MSSRFPRHILAGDTNGAMRDVADLDRKLTVLFKNGGSTSVRYQELAAERAEIVEEFTAWHADPELGNARLELHFPKCSGSA